MRSAGMATAARVATAADRRIRSRPDRTARARRYPPPATAARSTAEACTLPGHPLAPSMCSSTCTVARPPRAHGCRPTRADATAHPPAGTSRESCAARRLRAPRLHDDGQLQRVLHHHLARGLRGTFRALPCNAGPDLARAAPAARRRAGDRGTGRAMRGTGRAICHACNSSCQHAGTAAGRHITWVPYWRAVRLGVL